jgi:Zn-dependent peptidase ImmA (M78 family)
MTIIGLERLSYSDIAVKVENVLNEFDPTVLEKPNPTQLLKIVNKLKAEGKIQFAFKDLGRNGEGKIIGMFSPRLSSIFIDETIRDSPQFKFTLAHELAHYFLHRNVIYSQADYEAYSDVYFDLDGRKKLVTDKDFIEWQANAFAAELLMPERTFRKALKQCQDELEMSKESETINRNTFRKQYYSIIKQMLSDFYQVSLISVGYRLNHLKLVTSDSQMPESSEPRSLNEIIEAIINTLDTETDGDVPF